MSPMTQRATTPPSRRNTFPAPSSSFAKNSSPLFSRLRQLILVSIPVPLLKPALRTGHQPARLVCRHLVELTPCCTARSQLLDDVRSLSEAARRMNYRGAGQAAGRGASDRVVRR